MRHSHVVYILIRLFTVDGPALLLRRHEKWGDWSLVGGHVEASEMDNWELAAAREATEELDPLVNGRDFVVEPIHDEPIKWGPEPSRSKQGERTMYYIQYYTLSFLRDPIALLGRLPAAEFLLVPERELDSAGHTFGSPVHRARRFLRGGFEAAQRAWPGELDPRAFPPSLRPVIPDPGAATMK
jgi:hypothetical protein